MPRAARVTPGGMVFHVLNRGVGRMRLFHKDADFAAFEEILAEVVDLSPMRVCSYCLMPNHWHLVLWPEHDGDLPVFMERLTVTHVTRWQRHRGQVGYGHVYQGRFKSFPVSTDEYFYQVVRYVERNVAGEPGKNRRRPGAGPACGGASAEPGTNGGSCPAGHSPVRATGVSLSTSRKRRRKSRRSVAASIAGDHSVRGHGPTMC